MKYFVFILAFLLLPNYLFAQKTIGFDTTILGCNEQSIYKERYISINHSNEKYILGAFKNSCTLGAFTITTNSNLPIDFCRGVYLSKYDSQNNLIWLKKIGESDSLRTFKSTIDKSGNILLAIEYRTTLYIYNDTILNNGLTDIIILKIDSSGNEVFRKKIASQCFETINSIAIDDTNNIYFTGVFGIDANNTVNNCPTYFDTLFVLNDKKCFLAKMDSLGNYKWINKYDIEVINSIFCFENSLYCLGQCGKLNNSIGSIALNYSLGVTSKGFIAKLDSYGNGIWGVKFGTAMNLQFLIPSDICVSKNIIYFAGGSDSNGPNVFIFDGGPTLTGNGNNQDYFIACYDTLGNFKWNTISNTFVRASIAQLAVDSQSNVYGAGIFETNLFFSTDTLHGYGSFDAMVLSYDSLGSFRWAINGGGTNTDVVNDIAIDAQGKLYIVGGTTSNECYMGNDTLYPTTGQSTLFFAGIDSIDLQAPLGNTNTEILNAVCKIYPNPVDGVLHCELPITNDEKQIELRNIFGQLVYSTSIEKKFNHPFEINTSTFFNGIYFFCYKSKLNTFTKKIRVQH